MVFTPPRNRRGRPTSYKSLPDKSIDFDGDQKGVTIYAKEPGNFEYMELLDKCMEENDGRGADLDYGYKTMFMRFMYVCANEGHPTKDRRCAQLCLLTGQDMDCKPLEFLEFLKLDDEPLEESTDEEQE